MADDPRGPNGRPGRRWGWDRDLEGPPPGKWLFLGGLMVAALFAVFFLPLGRFDGPVAFILWCGVAVSLSAALYGLYRWIRGPGALDRPHGPGARD